jgi:CoA:oxalate CoA-transferase
MGVLENVRVLDLTRVLSGPYCTMMLADLGAEVIKIERPGAGDDSRSFGPFINGESAYFMSINRNKQSITLDLKKAEGKEIFLKLVDKADIVVENFRPGTMEKLGLDAKALLKRNEKLVFASISGFGQTGPYSRRAAYDAVVQAMGGIISITGEKGNKGVRVGSSIGDIISGIYCAFGVLAALRKRDKTGKGEIVDIAMLDSIVSILENAIARYQVTGENPKPAGNAHQSIFPFESFPTGSDDEIMIAAGNDILFKKLCETIDREDLARDARLLTNPLRGENYDFMFEELSKGLSKKSADEWYELLTLAGVPASKICRVSDVFSNPQVIERDMLQKYIHPVAGEVTVAGSPVKLGGEKTDNISPAPVLGNDNERVLSELCDLDKEAIAYLLDKEII